MKISYWSCSKFADWVRGTTKPDSETSLGWKNWKKEAKTKHPFRFWFVEEFLDNLQDIVYWIPNKLDSVRYYVNNRWVSRTNSLTAHPSDIKPGQWRDLSDRFLPCMFNELVDYVEIEKAWIHCVWCKESRKKFNYPWWRRWYRQWRCPEAGIAHLNWEMGLTNDWLKDDDPARYEPTLQAVNAKEVYELYKWWKDIRPKRLDPYDVSGWSDLCDEARQKDDERDLFVGMDQIDPDKTKKSLDSLHSLEEQYEKEDEEMMIRLIRVRRCLWT